jgi:hypothetical protein
MAQILAGMASSHAYAFMKPEQWDERRKTTQSRYAAQYGHMPEDHSRVAQEPLEDGKRRFTAIQDGLARLKQNLERLKPDALVLLGDDQYENFNVDNIPQFAIFTGERFNANDRASDTIREYDCPSELANHIHQSCVDAGVDMASCERFAIGHLTSHAHTQVLHYLQPQMPVVPIFVNAIHQPAPTPSRCYEVGRRIRQALDTAPGDPRVVLYASGGLSHFTSGYPWKHYDGPLKLGSICEDFDHRIMDMMREGRGDQIAALSSKDLIENGDIEFRLWITMLGIMDAPKPEWLVYEPIFRGIMGMGVGYWPNSQN